MALLTELVVFLPMLEYYQGILFLTTNRLGSFDKAFMSRIHLSIHYPPLSPSSQRSLWSTFLRRASNGSTLAIEGGTFLDEVAKEPLNGRQIKNLVRTACALAIDDASANGRVGREHILSALQPMKQFVQNMEKAHRRREQLSGSQDAGPGGGNGVNQEDLDEDRRQDLNESEDEDQEYSNLYDIEEDRTEYEASTEMDEHKEGNDDDDDSVDEGEDEIETDGEDKDDEEVVNARAVDDGDEFAPGSPELPPNKRRRR